MNLYDITILYARHGLETDAPQDFPHQTISPDRIQLISVWENDVFNPRRKSLETIKKADGRFVIMLDEGDKFDSFFLEHMLAKASEPETAFVMPSLTWQKRQPNMPEFFSLETSEDIRIDIRTSQRIFPLELHGLMIPSDMLKEAYSHIHSEAEPEKQVILSLLGKTPCFQYLGTCPLEYILARECNPEYDMRCQIREWYYEPLEQFLLPLLEKESAAPPVSGLIQAMAIHMLNIRITANINNKNKHVIPLEDVPSYMELFSIILQYVDTATIMETENPSQPAISSAAIMLLLLRLKKRDFSYYPHIVLKKQAVRFACDGFDFGGLERILLNLYQLDYAKGHLEIDGAYNDYFHDSEAQVYARFDKKKYSLNYNQRYSMTKYFGVTASRMKTFHVSIPVPQADHDRLLQFVFCTQGKEFVLEYAFPAHGSRFAKDFGYEYWRFSDYLAFWNKKGIHVVKSSKLLVLKKEISLWLQMWKKKDGFYRDQLPIKILNFLLRPYYSRQKIWLFIDKIYKGGDSSEYMYRYAEKQKDGIKKYYLLDEASADYARMKKEGYHPLKRGSLKHRLVFLNADMVIASNSTVFAFNDYSFERSLPIRSDVHFDVACVQHGMSVQKIAIAQQRLRDNTRLYFCASKYEIENLSKPVYDYVGYDALKLTGVPRYDGLKNRAQKIIVISPTWRMQSALPVSRNEGVARDFNPHFKETNYYKVYNGLINDPRLLEAARTYGYRIQYVLHPIVSPQHDDFTKNDLVEIIPSIGDMSYEKIFCEGALMVTDFSGVQFDFAYMRKPVVYLHHNDIPQHYEEGTFHYKTMGFGEICHTNEELIDVLCSYMKNDCIMPEMYRRRADDFFAFSDNHNCERIYPIMLEHTKNRSIS
ncbi:MAG: CDP-glycerol glycerophosphotransferase family protein [Lachnospiraceae bacterium]|nr:CDP-glycerol glycerophosphotransferase family protein [Lachnospiraceae bacterium]